jgi:hypothetical protein
MAIRLKPDIRRDAERLRNTFFYEIGAQVRGERLDILVVDAKNHKIGVMRTINVGISSIKYQCQATIGASRAPRPKEKPRVRPSSQERKTLDACQARR